MRGTYKAEPPAGPNSAGSRLLGLPVIPLLVGLLFFAASLTPSLIPRTWLVQGVLGGLVMGIGFMLAQLLLAAYRAMELPRLTGWAGRIAHLLVALPVLAITIWAIVNAADWQDSIRSHLEMPPVQDFRNLSMLCVAIAVFLLCFGIGWVVQRLFDTLRFRLYRVMPMRTANVLGLLLAGLILYLATRDGVVPAALDVMDTSYAKAQDLFVNAPPAPTEDRLPGSAASLVNWGAMGQPGRNFILDGPDAAAITAFSGSPAIDPIRVYVGLAQTGTAQARAEVALREMQRLGAFDRKVLVVASPTGTGWLDPAGHDPLEFMHGGDIATVAVQYSYLQSPLALIFQTDAGLDQATATMRTIYNHWRDLPADDRPDLYMHGISLGAWSSMYSFDMFRIFEDPINGALWTGPPFPSQLWRQAMAERLPDTPYVLPQVGSGRLVRFMSQFAGPDRHDADWGALRVVFMQHASDPIVFYEPDSLWRRPEWMREPPAQDVSAEIHFVPVVTQFQLALDMALAKAVPEGFGHNYLAEHYVDAWAAVTAPDGWTAQLAARLKDWCGLQWGLGCRK